MGSIKVACGPMFSGKTTELLREIEVATRNGLKIEVYKPRIDDRYGEDYVVSHTGMKVKCVPVTDPREILDAIERDVDFVGIDEIQFFDQRVVDVCIALANNGIRVVTSGLDTDFLGRPFGPMGELLAVAEHVVKLTAICQMCGGDATRSQRLVDGEPASADDSVVVVGGNESYEPRCRNHHYIGN